VCPKPVVTSCDTKTGHEVIDDSPDSGLPLQRSPIGHDETVDWNSHDEGDVKPVNMFVPVCFGNGFLGDVRFLWVVSLVTIWLRWLSHARRNLGGVGGHLG
jgi:hypothetical protein